MLGLGVFGISFSALSTSFPASSFWLSTLMSGAFDMFEVLRLDVLEDFALSTIFADPAREELFVFSLLISIVFAAELGLEEPADWLEIILSL